MKKFFALFSVLAWVTAVYAYNFQVGDLYYNIISSSAGNEQVEVTYQYWESSNNYAGVTKVSVPEEVTYNDVTYKVTRIGNGAFYRCTSLVSIVIPTGVTTISSTAFRDCISLTSVTLPASLKSIGEEVFYGCVTLLSVSVPDGVTSIGRHVFRDCSSLTTISLPDGVTSLGSYAFYGCSALATISLPKNLQSIGDYVFNACKSLNSITIPDGVTSVGSYAFYGCSALASVTLSEKMQSIAHHAFYDCPSLKSITLPDSVTTIGSNAFSYCSSLTIVSFPANLKTISSEAFRGCSSLTSVSFSNELKTVGSYAFYNCTSLSSVAFSNGLTTISDYAFCNCNSLTEITLPSSVTTIGSYAFRNIKGLYVYCDGEKPAEIGTDVFESTACIYVPSMDAYKTAWSAYASLITPLGSMNGTKVTLSAHAEKSALHQALGLDSLGQIVKLKINGSINSYDIMMLRNQMPLLRELDLSDATILANVYEYTKGYCSKKDTLTTQSFTGTGTKIAKVILPKSLKHIEAGAFNTYVRDITIFSNDVRVLPTNTFYNCSSLRNIILPDSLEVIGDYAFQGTDLRSITIPRNVSRLGVGAFAGPSYGYSSSEYYSSSTSNATTTYYATSGAMHNSSSGYSCSGGSLCEVIIPKDSKLKTIPSRAFEGNENLTKLQLLGDSIKTIGDVAFRRCALDTLILPPNLESISTLSFGYCTGLKYVVMPKTITEVPHNAFVGCTNLNDIQFPTKLTSIGHHAFADCTNLSNVDIPGLVTSIGDYAFKSCNVKQVHSYLFDPFTIGQNTFSAYANANATLYIPNVEDTELKYLYDTQWSQFLNRVRMDKSFEYDDFYATGDVVLGENDDPLQGNPNAELKPGSGLVVEDGKNQQNLGVVTLYGEVGDWASILAGCNLNVDTLLLKIMVQGKKWHFFGFPFQIKISDIITDGKFVVYEYDGEIRAERDTTGWKKIPDHQQYLYPGQGYIFQFNFAVEGYFAIKVNKPDFCKIVELIDLVVHPSSKPNNKNWNYVANPFLAYFDINDLDYTGPITFWDVLNGTYQSVRPGDDEYYISPYEAFFLQNITDKNTTITFNKEDGMTKNQLAEYIKNLGKKSAPAQRTNASARSIINLTLSNGDKSDDTRVVINEQATLGYDMGVDAAKFMSSENVPQLFSYDQGNTQCAINERPISDGTINLGVKLPATGQYTLSCTRMDMPFYLLDREENIVHDLQSSEYQFTASAGTDASRFALVQRHDAPTDVEDVVSSYSIETTYNGLYINGHADVQIYSLTGVLVEEGLLSGFVPLTSGVYLVVTNGHTTKHIIR